MTDRLAYMKKLEAEWAQKLPRWRASGAHPADWLKREEHMLAELRKDIVAIEREQMARGPQRLIDVASLTPTEGARRPEGNG